MGKFNIGDKIKITLNSGKIVRGMITGEDVDKISGEIILNLEVEENSKNVDAEISNKYIDKRE